MSNESPRPVGFTAELQGNPPGEGPVRAVLHPFAAEFLPPGTNLYGAPQLPTPDADALAEFIEQQWRGCFSFGDLAHRICHWMEKQKQ